MKRTGLIVATIALLAAGCGDDSTAGTTSTQVTPTSTTPSSTGTAPETTATPSTSVAPTTTSLPTTAAACDHLYMPVVAGNSWTFATAAGQTITWAVTSTSADGTAATMDAEVASDEDPTLVMPIAVNLLCGDFGMQAPELALGGLPFGASATQVVEEGVFLPPADEMTPGSTWTSVVTVTAEFPGAAGMAVEIRREVVYTVVGEEEIEVPAGTFTALRIESEFTQEISMGGNPIPAVTGTQVQWMAPGVGLIAEAGEFEGADFDLELVEVSLAS